MFFRRILVLTVAIMMVLTACKKEKPLADKKPVDDDKQPVMIEVLEPRTLQEFITVSGKLEGGTDITMLSETSGRIMQMYKKLGDKVTQGERIGMVDNDVYRIRFEQAEAAKLSAEAAFETAQLNLNTSDALFKKKSISQVEYNTALTAFKGAKANLDGAKAGWESARRAYDNSYLVAPEAGVITNLMVSQGQFINNGTPIATIVDDKVLLIKTGVGESQIGKIRQGQSADIKHNDMDKPVKGFVKAFGIRPLANTANYPLEIQVSNKTGLMPGMVVTAKILSGTFQNQLYTSVNNVINEYDHAYLYVVNDKDIALRKEVKLGRIVGENIIILSGVEVGERIVISGMENIEDNTPVQIRR